MRGQGGCCASGCRRVGRAASETHRRRCGPPAVGLAGGSTHPTTYPFVQPLEDGSRYYNVPVQTFPTDTARNQIVALAKKTRTATST